MKAAGTILLVEDQEAVRKLVRTALFSFGHQDVAEADGPDRALEIARHSRTPIPLLLSDIDLGADIDGIQLAKTITGFRPEVKVLLMSGQAHQPRELAPGWQFIPKPFMPSELLATVRQILEADPVEVRQAIADLTVFTLDLKKAVIPAATLIDHFRVGPGHEGLLPQNPNVASFHCRGEVFFNLAHEIVGKTIVVSARRHRQAA